MLGQVRGEIPGVPTTPDPRHTGRELRDGPVQQLRGDRPGILVGLHQIRGQAHTALGPEREMRPVSPLPLIVVDRVLLVPAVHLHIGGIPIDRGRRQQLGPPPVRHQPQHPGVHHADRLLDPGQMCCGETLRHLRGGRRRRRGHRLQLLPRGIGAAVVHSHQEIRTRQVRRRHRQQQSTRGHPAAAGLDRSHGIIQCRGDTQHPIQLGHRRHTRMTGHPRISLPDQHPTEPTTARRTPRRRSNR